MGSSRDEYTLQADENNLLCHRLLTGLELLGEG